MRRFAASAVGVLVVAGCAGSIVDSHRRISDAAAAITEMRRACLARNGTDCGSYTPTASVGQVGHPGIFEAPAVWSERSLLQQQAALIEDQRACLERHQSDPKVDCSGYLPPASSK